MIKRRESWPEALADYIDARHDESFEFGRMDCCRFAAGAVQAMTGADPMADVPTYASAREAAALLDDLGGLERAASERLGDATLPNRAGRGDIVLVFVDGIQALGVCLGDKVAAPSRSGLIFMSRACIEMTWTIPHG